MEWADEELGLRGGQGKFNFENGPHEELMPANEDVCFIPSIHVTGAVGDTEEDLFGGPLHPGGEGWST
jgi:hypothetical protein